MIAWIRLDDSGIHYPVMHNKKDNEWYKTHDWQDEYSQAGSIYLDSFNEKWFNDGASIISGSERFSDRMFSDLKKWQDEKFFKEHRGGAIFVPGGEYRLQVVAALDLPQTSELLDAKKLLMRSNEAIMEGFNEQATQHKEYSTKGKHIFILRTFEGETAHVVVVLGEKKH